MEKDGISVLAVAVLIAAAIMLLFCGCEKEKEDEFGRISIGTDAIPEDFTIHSATIHVHVEPRP